jgi:hypothetical protein
MGSRIGRSGAHNFVSNPERVVLTLLDRLEFERYGSVLFRFDAVKERGNIVAAVDPWYKQEAYLVHQPRFKEGAVDVAAALEQQDANSEVFSKQVYRPCQVDGGLSVTM